MEDEKRIAELNDKASQLLLFLRLALVAAILLETAQVRVLTDCQKVAVKWSLRFWVFSILPILLIAARVGHSLQLAAQRRHQKGEENARA